MILKTLQLLFFFLTLIYYSSSIAANGQPFQDLQNQIDELQSKIDGLSEEVEVTVDCTNDTVTNALTTYKSSPGTLTINILGECVENVVMNRNNVTLQGVPGSIKALSSEMQALNIEGANGIIINNLAFIGAIYPNANEGNGVLIHSGASARVSNISVTGFDTGVIATDNGSLILSDSTLSDNARAIDISRGAIVRLANLQVNNNNNGLDVRDQGRADFAGGSIASNISSTISDNNSGIRVRRGGAIRLGSGVINIQNNNRGIRLEGFGILEGGSFVTISNNSRGLDCQNPLSFSLEIIQSPNFLANASITNNSVFDVDPECIILPLPPPPPLP